MSCSECGSPGPCDCGSKCPECSSTNTRTYYPETDCGGYTSETQCRDCDATF